jgi:hypothetical protein
MTTPTKASAYTPLQLASLYLTQNNLPNTPQNQAAIASWFTQESGNGTNVFITPNTSDALYYNNPLGILGSGDAGYHTVYDSSGKAYNYASYSTAQAGAAGWGALIKSNYPSLWQGLLSGNSIDAVKAASPTWVGNSTGYGNSLITTYNTLLGIATNSPTSTSPVPAGATSTTDTALAPVGTIAHLLGAGTTNPNLSPTSGLTQAEIDTITGDIPVDNPNRATIISALEGQIGSPINTLTEPDKLYFSSTGGLQNLIFGQAGVSGQGGGILDTGATPSSIFGSVVGTIGPVVALLFGGAAIIFGIFLIYKDTSSSNTNTVIQKTVPIVYRGA